ncbi:hypothetical protein C9374_005142 [Naegleria lovaniensis]|uniref:UBX domain-containing protein n=1 Tax=Naegleria lovaniensis TaxID=51637 RepID=A0AA88KIT4_NAELO|nr:uncharacterized protein C9374_005142 [Naegleria lovaniensis]KAG2382562.1 hypothetical protein C9374_005142 [Naegleria lovaniensis]
MSSSSSSTPEEKVTLNIRLLDGTPLQVIFKAEAKLSVVQRYVQVKAVELEKHKLPFGSAYIEDNGIEFETLMPKKRFHFEEFPNITLKEAGLFPKAALVVVRVNKDPNDLKRGKGTIADAQKGDVIHHAHHVRGDNHEKKQAFAEKQRLEEQEQKKKEVEEKKRELEKIRAQIKEDKDTRQTVDWVGNALKKDKKDTTKSANIPPSDDQ